MAKNKERRKARDTFEILATILKICQESTRRTLLIYKANLSFNMLRTYVELAIRAGLLEEELRSRSLKTTEKGKSFLEAYDAIKRLVEEDSMTRDPIMAKASYYPIYSDRAL